jgi:hypothetical protein
MTLDELGNRLLVGRSRSVCVDIAMIPDLSGFVRTITIRPNNEVAIEFNSYGYDEGGACFVGKFDSLEGAATSVEEYLGVPMSAWASEHEYPPPPPTALEVKASEERLASAIATEKLTLPRGSRFELEESYWSRFIPQGRK